MITLGSSSDELIKKIKIDAGVWTADMLRDVLAAGRRQRAPDYDAIIKGIAIRYVGDQAGIVRDALRRRYPRTGDRMPIDPINWMRFFARQDSGVYDGGVTRTLVDADGEPIGEDDPRARAFARSLEQIGADGLLAECERRANTGARAVLVMLGHRLGETVAHIYWPHDVVTICHPSAVDDERAMWCIAIKQAREQTSTASDVWWVWTRPWADDDGDVTFGQWTHRRISEDGKIATASETYDGVFPGAILRTESPVGGMWPEPDRDVSINVDALNVARSNRQYVIDMQAHATTVYSGTMRETNELVGGPGSVVQIGAGESMQYLVPGADHHAIEASATRDLHELGVARGNSPDAYAVEPGAPQSGVSRIIANAPHDRRIAEVRPIYRRFEEERLWPIVLDLLARFDRDAPADFGDARVRVTMSTAKGYEDDASKTERVLSLLSAGVIDDADARVMLGLSSDRASALAYIDAMRVSSTRAGIGGVITSPFAALRETTR